MVDVNPDFLEYVGSLSHEEVFKRVFMDDFGCYNRKYFERLCSLNFSDISNGRFSLMITDADSFKRINDDFSHAYGDLAIKRLFSNANAAIQELDEGSNRYCCRLGGDEGVVLGFGNSEELIGDFERILLGMSRTKISPHQTILNPETGQSELMDIGILASGGYVDTSNYLYLLRNVFPQSPFFEAINEALSGGVDILEDSSEHRPLIYSKDLLEKYKVLKDDFDTESVTQDIGIDPHQFNAIVSYLTKLEISEFTPQLMTDNPSTNYASLFAVAMLAEADNRLYEAKRAGGGFCFGRNNVKSIKSGRLETLTLDEIKRQNNLHDERKKRIVR